MGDRRQVTGDKCGIVTGSESAGDKSRRGFRSGDTCVPNCIRTPDCSSEVRNNGLATLKFDGATVLNAARDPSLDCGHDCVCIQRPISPWRARSLGSIRVALGVSLAEYLRMGRQHIVRLERLKTGSTTTKWRARWFCWPQGIWQSFQGRMSELLCKTETYSEQALRTRLSGLSRSFSGHIWLNVACRAF